VPTKKNEITSLDERVVLDAFCVGFDLNANEVVEYFWLVKDGM
jgi:hypothetical protein